LFWEHPYFIFKNKFTQFILYYPAETSGTGDADGITVTMTYTNAAGASIA